MDKLTLRRIGVVSGQTRRRTARAMPRGCAIGDRARSLPAGFHGDHQKSVERKFSDLQAQLLDYEADARDFVFELPQEEVGVVVHVGSAVPACSKRNAANQVSRNVHLLSRNAVIAEAQLGRRRRHEQMRIVQEGLQKEDLLNAA